MQIDAALLLHNKPQLIVINGEYPTHQAQMFHYSWFQHDGVNVSAELPWGNLDYSSIMFSFRTCVFALVFVFVFVH